MSTIYTVSRFADRSAGQRQASLESDRPTSPRFPGVRQAPEPRGPGACDYATLPRRSKSNAIKCALNVTATPNIGISAKGSSLTLAIEAGSANEK